jgi:MinD-like ATPase involved in chromosome partitioning or flagellar assembly
MSEARATPKGHTVGNRILSVGGGKGGTGKSLITSPEPTSIEAAKKYFGIPIDFLGSVSYDNTIRNGLLQRKPLTAYYPYAKVFEELIEITEKISPQHQLGRGFS